MDSDEELLLSLAVEQSTEQPPVEQLPLEQPPVEQPGHMAYAEFQKTVKFKISEWKVSATDLHLLPLSATLSTIKKNTSGNLAAVIVSKSQGTGASGARYGIWTLGDMHHTTCILFVFKDAFKTYYGIGEGNVIIISPSIVPESYRKGKGIALKIESANDLVIVGRASDFGYCTAQTRNNSQCKNYINKSVSKYCDKHVGSQLKMVRNRNVALNQTFTSDRLYGLSMFTTSQNKSTRGTYAAGRGQCMGKFRLDSSGTVVDRATLTVKDPQQLRGSIGAMQIAARDKMSKGTQKKTGYLIPGTPAEKRKLALQEVPRRKKLVIETLDDAKQAEERKQVAISAAYSGEVSLRSAAALEIGPVSAPLSRKEVADAAMARAIAKIGENRIGIGVESSESPQSEKPVDVQAVAAQKSQLGHLIEQHDVEQAKHKFNLLEEEEKMATQLDEVMEMQVDAYRCATCRRVSEFPNRVCKNKGHVIQKMAGKAVKRFFLCTECKQRKEVLDQLLPLEPCFKCQSRSFKRVGSYRGHRLDTVKPVSRMQVGLGDLPKPL